MLLLSVLGTAALAQPDPFAALGFEVVVPEGCVARPESGGAVLVCRGHSLLLMPGAGEVDPLLMAQVAPFREVGATIEDTRDEACRLAGEAATCRALTVRVPPGPPLQVVAGRAPDGAWTAVCLVRGPQGPLPATCAPWVALPLAPVTEGAR